MRYLSSTRRRCAKMEAVPKRDPLRPCSLQPESPNCQLRKSKKFPLMLTWPWNFEGVRSYLPLNDESPVKGNCVRAAARLAAAKFTTRTPVGSRRAEERAR